VPTGTSLFFQLGLGDANTAAADGRFRWPATIAANGASFLVITPAEEP